MNFDTSPIKKTARIDRLLDAFYNSKPEIEPARAELITESYKATENLPEVERKSRAFEHILDNIPIVIRDDELIVGSTTIKMRGCQTYPEFSYEWLEAEFDTVLLPTCWWALQYAEYVEVLGPQALRDMIAQSVRTLERTYDIEPEARSREARPSGAQHSESAQSNPHHGDPRQSDQKR